MLETSTTFLQQQTAYYQARASEYDEWFLRQGREFEIVKISYPPDALATQLRALDWQVTISTTSNYFLSSAGNRT